jgi:integrase
MGATYRKRGKRSWLVTVHTHGERQFKTVRSEADAKALVQYIHKQELAGVNVAEAMQKARATAAPAPTFPTLREAVPTWIDAQVAAREFRGSTGEVYRTVLARWAFAHTLPDGRLLGDVPVNAVTREMLGAVITRVRGAGRSATLVTQIPSPLRGFYQQLIETKTLPGPNPAADLKFFAGKRKKATAAVFFTQEEGPTLVAAAKALHPRWHAFILTGLLAGLRWGESAALYKTDIDWARGRLHVQRTVSGDGSLQACKDHDSRYVKASTALLHALHEHIEQVTLEAQMHDWNPDQRRLVFPNTVGRLVDYPAFLVYVWKPLLAKAGLTYRKYHSTRHTFATWLLSDGADLRWVQQQMGHATIAQTADTYGHVQPERHESAVEGLDQYVK